jgi:hypothetical protein
VQLAALGGSNALRSKSLHHENRKRFLQSAVQRLSAKLEEKLAANRRSLADLRSKLEVRAGPRPEHPKCLPARTIVL